jgi:hypothetical protein
MIMHHHLIPRSLHDLLRKNLFISVFMVMISVLIPGLASAALPYGANGYAGHRDWRDDALTIAPGLIPENPLLPTWQGASRTDRELLQIILNSAPYDRIQAHFNISDMADMAQFRFGNQSYGVYFEHWMILRKGKFTWEQTANALLRSIWANGSGGEKGGVLANRPPAWQYIDQDDCFITYMTPYPQHKTQVKICMSSELEDPWKKNLWTRLYIAFRTQAQWSDAQANAAARAAGPWVIQQTKPPNPKVCYDGPRPYYCVTGTLTHSTTAQR